MFPATTILCRVADAGCRAWPRKARRRAAAPADALVIFGITGDLAKKMTFQALYDLTRTSTLDGAGHRRGVETTGATTSCTSTRARRSSAVEAKDDVDRRGRLQAVHGRPALRPGRLQRVRHLSSGRSRRSRARSTRSSTWRSRRPSSPAWSSSLGEAGLTKGARVVIEKPFGHDLQSAIELNDQIHEILDEEQIYRIDHFLGKEPVQDITYLRFANSLLEPIWNRRYVESRADHDGRGLRGRGPRQLLRPGRVPARRRPEPPAADARPGGDGAARPAPTPTRSATRKLDLFKAIPAADPNRYVRGQYEGYREIEGVAPKSRRRRPSSGCGSTSRTGAGPASRSSSARASSWREDHRGPGGSPEPAADRDRRRSDPGDGRDRHPHRPRPRRRSCSRRSKPGEEKLRQVHLDLLFKQQFGDQPGPYERLLADALAGDQQRFAREDSVLETWRIVQPLIDKPCQLETYSEGSWGPEGASNLLHGYGGWRRPWLPRRLRSPSPRE